MAPRADALSLSPVTLERPQRVRRESEEPKLLGASKQHRRFAQTLRPCVVEADLNGAMTVIGHLLQPHHLRNWINFASLSSSGNGQLELKSVWLSWSTSYPKT